MVEELNDEEELEAGITLSLRKNPLANDGSMIPQVSARKASVKMALTEIEKENSNVDTSLMRHHLKLYQEKLLDLLKRGYDVKVMDLGALHIKAKGLVRSKEEAAQLSEWTVRFTPTKMTVDAVKGLSVDVASIPDTAPLIESVTDLCRGEADGQVTAGQPVRISGMRLKLAEGDGNFIAFVPQDEAGRDEPDEAKWLFAERDKLIDNMPRVLSFFAPEGLEAGGKYRIRVSSTFVSTRIARQSPLWGESEEIVGIQ